MARLFEIVQFFTDAAAVLNGGKVHTFEAGTTTQKAAYTDQGAGTPHANPIVLDSAGRAQIWLSGGAYKIRIDDSDDVTLMTLDNVAGDSPIAGSPIASRSSVSATLTCTDNAVVLTASSLVPANRRCVGVYVENTVAPGTSKSLSGYDVGSHGVTERWGANIGLSLNNKNTVGDFALAEQPVSGSAQDVTITALGGTFDGTGTIVVTAEIEQGTAP